MTREDLLRQNSRLKESLARAEKTIKKKDEVFDTLLKYKHLAEAQLNQAKQEIEAKNVALMELDKERIKWSDMWEELADTLQAKDQEIERLKAQIEAMKCCENCKRLFCIDGFDFEKFGVCKAGDYSQWQLKIKEQL